MEKNNIIHNKQEHRFELTKNGHLALVAYQLSDKETMDIYHTEVPEAIEGQGIGSSLIKAALDYARRHHYRIIPTCPFAKAYLLSHPD